MVAFFYAGLNKMLMPAWTMHMTMLQFFCSGIANSFNGYIKVKIFARQRMVAIYCDSLVGHCSNGDRNRATLSGLSFKLHSHFYLLNTLK